MLTLLTFLLHPHCPPQVLSAFLACLTGRRHRIEPALSAQPVAHLRHKAALFALPVFRGGKAPNGGMKFSQRRQLSASQELELGQTREALGLLFGVHSLGGFKIGKRRRHTPAAGVLAMRRTGLAVVSPGVWGKGGSIFLCLLRLVK